MRFTRELVGKSAGIAGLFRVFSRPASSQRSPKGRLRRNTWFFRGSLCMSVEQGSILPTFLIIVLIASASLAMITDRVLLHVRYTAIRTNALRDMHSDLFQILEQTGSDSAAHFECLQSKSQGRSLCIANRSSRTPSKIFRFADQFESAYRCGIHSNLIPASLSVGSALSGFDCVSLQNGRSMLGNLVASQPITIRAGPLDELVTIAISGAISIDHLEIQSTKTMLLAGGDIAINNLIVPNLPEASLAVISASGSIVFNSIHGGARITLHSRNGVLVPPYSNISDELVPLAMRRAIIFGLIALR